jgi:fermentation-respiration switch protein FrsA (DUF1100 family)
MPNRVHSFDFVDVHNVRQAGLAQEQDIRQLKAQIDAKKDKNIVLLALSRGASTTISTMGTYRPQNVRAIIVESPFDDVRSVVSNQVSYARYIPGVTALGNLAAGIAFPHYSSCDLRPIDLVTNIPDRVPVLFICSKGDKLIPTWSSERLYEKLKNHRLKRGINNVYLLKTERGAHAHILNDNQEAYQGAVHAFYKASDLPESTYNGALADHGREFLTQP